MKFCSRERKLVFHFELAEVSSYRDRTSIVDTYTLHTFILKLPVWLVQSGYDRFLTNDRLIDIIVNRTEHHA